jgi:hypothetical protein
MLTFQPSVAISAESLQHPLVVVLVPGLSLQDFNQYKNLNWLSENAAMGLMNSSSGNGRRIASSYLSLSTGTKVACSEKEGALLYQNTETLNEFNVSDLYLRYLNKPVKGYDVLMPGFISMLGASTNTADLDLLADVFELSSVPFIFIGNHDLPGTISRPCALFAVDSFGRIKNGYVDERTYKVSAYSPTYFSTNYSFYYEETVKFIDKDKGLIFLDLGDLVRLDSISSYLTNEIYINNRDKLLKELDAFLEQIISLVDITKGQLLLITPFPDSYSLQIANSLTPVTYYNTSTSGIISSASTKRPGIITNLDIAPTMFKLTGIEKPPSFIGTPLYTIPQDEPLEYLQTLLSQILINYNQRPIILKGYVLLQIFCVLSVLILILLRLNNLLYRVKPFLLLLTTAPLLFLLLPLLPITNLYIRSTVLLLTGIFIVFLLEKKMSTIQRLAHLFLITALCIAVDLLFGATLMKSSLLGYDANSGARYYGLGNEYMGVLLGSSLIGLSLLLESLLPIYPQHRSKLLIMVCIIIAGLTILVAAPQWGTNVGGAISFTGSFVLFCILIMKKRIHLKTIGFAGLCCTTALIMLFIIDLQRPMEVQSHIGLTARLIHEQGLSSLWPIFSRKINMNIKLLHYSLWSRVFLTFLGATAFIFYKPPGQLKKIFTTYPYLKAGFITGLSGSFITLVVNDSGIVAAATSSIFVVTTLLYLITEQISK